MLVRQQQSTLGAVVGGGISIGSRDDERSSHLDDGFRYHVDSAVTVLGSPTLCVTIGKDGEDSSQRANHRVQENRSQAPSSSLVHTLIVDLNEQDAYTSDIMSDIVGALCKLVHTCGVQNVVIANAPVAPTTHDESILLSQLEPLLLLHTKGTDTSSVAVHIYVVNAPCKSQLSAYALDIAAGRTSDGHSLSVAWLDLVVLSSSESRTTSVSSSVDDVVVNFTDEAVTTNSAVVESRVLDILHEQLPDLITEDQSIWDLGLTSAMAIVIAEKLSSHFDLHLPSTTLFDYTDVSSLATLIRDELGATTTTAVSREIDDDVNMRLPSRLQQEPLKATANSKHLQAATQIRRREEHTAMIFRQLPVLEESDEDISSDASLWNFGVT